MFFVRPLLRARLLFPFVLAIAATGALYGHAQPTPAGTPTGSIVTWTDGDTVRVRLDGLLLICRLIGIDTPESRVNSRTDLQSRQLGRDLRTILALGRQAKTAAIRLAPPGTPVRVEWDVQRLDRYQRALVYLYLPDGRMINEELVQQGYAMVLTIPPNVRYADRFLRAERTAREQRRGLWAGS